ncbi:MAG: hypothetical protein O7J95_18135 [Planctomycetota bacterium]|nr:hypothetical protein [Planctomycetota bacterium]
MRDEPIPASGVESIRVAGLDDLLGLFPETRRMLRGVRGIPAPAVPSPYRELLVHEEHMTVTLERFHGAPVDLEVFEVRRDGDDYARRLILRVGAQGPVVLAGIVRIQLEQTGDAVRRDILSARTPLGRVLIENGVLRRLQTAAFLRLELSHGLGEVFGAPASCHTTYGRLATIHCDERPAIELLEIVAPAGDGT